ncbi:hypothetical protein TNCV_1296011 [Trichonephila clavipes]|uniref:Uncharacterized protein n=1 Tax=Trichonephila clavipes TaxID=2585209 RepID=A0A8X6VNZ8_TRICX|nr:hypothetical protein TNCV_1296011 [Trichonephila clavipes]
MVDGLRNFEPRSSDEDSTRTSNFLLAIPTRQHHDLIQNELERNEALTEVPCLKMSLFDNADYKFMTMATWIPWPLKTCKRKHISMQFNLI